jgi:aspartate/methionine/tyrosine aminotransferase
MTISHAAFQALGGALRIMLSDMNLPPFALDAWLAQKHDPAVRVEFDLGSSTGPVWTLRELLALGGDLEELLDSPISYVSPRGTLALREAIGALEGCAPDSVQVTTGGAEGLLLIFSYAAAPGANVVLPKPGYPANDALAQAFGFEARHYRVRAENGFRIDIDEICRSIDDRTRLVLMNSPHNPAGATVSDVEMEAVHDYCAARSVQFLSDQVYHPIYHGPGMRSAARLPHATVLGDLSKAMCLSGLRIGWIIEPDGERRARYLNARSLFTVCSSGMAERLGVLALRQRQAIYARAKRIAAQNLSLLAKFFANERGVFRYTPPSGGMTAFPSALDGSETRPLCVEALRQGLLLAPGDCFGAPEHFRIGFAASGERFAAGLERLAEVVHGFERKRGAKTVGSE